MDTTERTAASKAKISGRGVPRTWLACARASASLVMIASALSGCASLAMEKALGPNPQLYPPVVEAYEWAGRRGDELVVVYRVWGGHPRRHETRWTALELRTATWVTGLSAPRAGELEDRPGPIPERDSTDPVPVVPLFGPLQPEVANAATTTAQRGRRRSRSTRAAGRPPS